MNPLESVCRKLLAENHNLIGNTLTVNATIQLTDEEFDWVFDAGAFDGSVLWLADTPAQEEGD